MTEPSDEWPPLTPERAELLKSRLKEYEITWLREFDWGPERYTPDSVDEGDIPPGLDHVRWVDALRLRRLLLARDPAYFDDECFRGDLFRYSYPPPPMKGRT